MTQMGPQLLIGYSRLVNRPLSPGARRRIAAGVHGILGNSLLAHHLHDRSNRTDDRLDAVHDNNKRRRIQNRARVSDNQTTLAQLLKEGRL